MRIISGRYRGMVLAEFKGENIRPTADRVKESLFNILYSSVAGARVLDMFCGSGNLGIECISRGAAEVHFNDISKDSLTVLKKNLSRIEGNYKITNCDFSCCMKDGDRYDLIFIDPPYASDAGIKALKLIPEHLSGDGIAVFERDRSFEGEIEGLKKVDERKYGKTYLSFFKKGEI